MPTYQVGDACYPTPSAAAMAAASTVSGSFVAKGPVLYQVNVMSVTDTTISYRFTPVGGGTVVNQTIGYNAQVCGLMGSADAVQLGWLIGGAWIAAYSVKFIARTIRDMINREEIQDGQH